MDETAAAKVLVVNRALLKLGQPASYTIDGNTQLAGIVDQVWPSIEARAVALYDWSFCRDTVKATPLAGPFDNGWQYGFALPGNRIGDPLAVLTQVSPCEQFLRDFMNEGGNLYCNVSPVWVRVRVMSDPTFWDLGFREAFATALAGALAVPVLMDEELEDRRNQEAWGRPQENGGGGLFGRLIALNRAATPVGRTFLDNDPLTAARRR